MKTKKAVKKATTKRAMTKTPVKKAVKKAIAKKAAAKVRGAPMALSGDYALGPSRVDTFAVKEFCQRFQMVRPDLTRLTGFSLRSVDKWAAGEEPGNPAKKQLKELVRLFDALAELMESKDVGPWLKAPNPAFAQSTPLQIIERGEIDRIWRMIYQLETGEPA
ncbi:hypothetical protein [Actomonas aquatica]|uniref:Antitoxin Xre/MbcA/ParS-like toxin-binding domain-containing protein n=1 Tax=Actomonas aquatica TaxID=2866162 RepID=A0ABZ1C6J6_9BACT|nr:hypothetical protein [Opitutus sp. WL0086]WRQ86154.1 hypothetical protein K1X11_015170 [Opitutus sp. WL0086]